MQGDGLAEWREWRRGEGLIPGEGLEPEEAAVCGAHVEAFPVCAAVQKGLLRPGTHL